MSFYCQKDWRNEKKNLFVSKSIVRPLGKKLGPKSRGLEFCTGEFFKQGGMPEFGGFGRDIWRTFGGKLEEFWRKFVGKLGEIRRKLGWKNLIFKNPNF